MNRHCPWRVVLLAVLLAVGLAAAPSPVRGQADGVRSLTIEAFELTARIEPDADVRIRESITARFQGSWRGLTREIPLVSRSAAGTVVTLYEPPTDLAPGQAGALIDERVDGRDLAPTLVDLAIRGMLAIREAGRNGLLRRPAFELELRRGHQEWNDLRGYERRLLDRG